MQASFEKIKKIKKIVFHIVFTTVIGSFISIYIGFLMPSQMPKLHKTLYQTLCKANEEVKVKMNHYSLPGEVRISTDVNCINSNGTVRSIHEFKSFVIVGFIYPFTFSFLLSLIFYQLFIKKRLL